MKQTKQVELPEKIEKELENLLCYEPCCYGEGDDSVHQEIRGLIAQAQQEAQNNTAMQCYLECLAVECGEGECSRAIVTKFGLEVHND